MISRGTVCALLALLAGYAVSADDDCPADCGSQSLHHEAQLHTDLLCGYNSNFRPVKDHKNPIQVKVRFALKYLTFDSLEETITIHSWVAISWKDEFLTWTPADYGEIKETQLQSHEIWTPGMSLFNADASMYPSDSFFTTCLVASDGTVTCVPQVAHSGICSTTLRRWPYDVQNCSLFFGSWIHTGEQINFTSYKTSPVVLDDYKNGPGWKLLNVTHERMPGKYNCCPNTTYPMLKYTFLLQREAAGPAAVVVVPSVVVVILTMVSLLLDVKDNVRLLLGCFSLFGHYMLLTEIGYDIPKHSVDTPIILLFIRDSMMMTLTVVILTLVLMALRKRCVPPPTWVGSVTRLAASGPGKYAIFTEFDPDTDKRSLTEDGPSSQTTETPQSASAWIQFCNLLNSFVFIVYVFVYFVLICIYIPY